MNRSKSKRMTSNISTAIYYCACVDDRPLPDQSGAVSAALRMPLPPAARLLLSLVHVVLMEVTDFVNLVGSAARSLGRIMYNDSASATELKDVHCKARYAIVS